MAKFEMYQVVRVLCVPKRENVSVPPTGNTRLPKIGDLGTVDVYLVPHDTYCVESVTSDDRAEWLVDFLSEELEAV